jgi:hypothetical protein
MLAAEEGIPRMTKFGTSALIGAGLIAVGFSAPAHASTMQTYDITLTQKSGTLITGSPLADFTVTSAPFTITVPTSGFLQDTPTVSFTIAGKTYTSVLDVQFNGPTVTSIFNFSATVGEDTLSSIGLTSFQLSSSNNPCCDIPTTIGGTVAFALAPAATPLPATLPLFAGGLGFVGYLTRRKKRAQAVAA